MDIPDRLAKKIEQNSALHGAVLQSVAEFQPWFDHSKTPFFPEYTDHSWRHVLQTMATAASLIQEEAWPLVTSTDAAVLVLAVVLHDCGMHLTEDGFLNLITGDSGQRTVEGWTEKPWQTLWSDYLGDASRFDARKLLALFGDAEPAHRPPADPSLWTARDKLLIGDFLRRHHPRLAHEIALHGVPGPGNPPLGLKGVPSDVADLAGLVARSHGLPIRACLPHLARFDLRDYKGAHAVFLMSLLRVADYIQIQPERAPRGVLRVQRLRSPLSQKEWNTHDAVRDIRHTHADPEAIEVDAAPKDVITFVRLRRLLSLIQGELDACWAVLGEVYGRYGLKDLGLSLRRIRSNIDDEAEFAKTVAYLPCESAFEAEGSELLKLLIKPLYGDHPEIGIRELLQNAVDACRELKDYLDQNPSAPAPDLPVQDADVVISLEDRGEAGRWLEVSDRGIGMTAEVIRKYFLKAGASFRRSDAWRRMHETAEGHSRVLRSGRFGVGVLSAFLLGNEVEVSTRGVSAPPDKGIAFAATIDTEEIELKYCLRPVGTTVRVRIDDEEVWKTLSKENRRIWDWYCLEKPEVSRVVIASARQEQLAQKFSLAGAGAPLDHKWRRVGCPDYPDIQWSYWDGPFLACNGITVAEADPRGEHYWEEGPPLGNSGHIALSWPHVSAFDPDGRLPLVLQRDSLATKQYPFHEELFADVVRDFLAYLLVGTPDRRSRPGEEQVWYAGASPRSTAGLASFHLCVAPDGAYPADEELLKERGFHRFLLAGGLSESGNPTTGIPLDPGDALLVPVPNPAGNQRYRDWNRFALCGGNYGYGHHSTFEGPFGYLRGFETTCRRMLLRRSEYVLIEKGRLITKYLWSSVEKESSVGDWVVVRSGHCHCGEHIDLYSAASLIPATAYWPVLIEWHLSSEQPSPEATSPLAQLCRDLLVSPPIPFDPDERRRRFPRAFEQLAQYVASHEQLAAQSTHPREGDGEAVPLPYDEDAPSPPLNGPAPDRR